MRRVTSHCSSSPPLPGPAPGSPRKLCMATQKHRTVTSVQVCEPWTCAPSHLSANLR